jgi:lysozyme
VWIARYGEYKPDIHLIVWQLSPDGRVQGITGEVDINVFNGYQTQFNEFIEKETIQ